MSRATDYLRTSKIISEIENNREKYLVIHYACEPFDNVEDGKSLKIVSIAVRTLSDGQTHIFNINASAELLNIDFAELTDKYETAEKHMLDNFFNFVQSNNTKSWIHWNMRDNFYGFYALEHRYKVLGGSSVSITNDKKIDLSLLLVNRYTDNYITAPFDDNKKDKTDKFAGSDRMKNLADLNKLTVRHFLKGEEEVAKFRVNDFITIARSTARKVQIFSDIVDRLLNNELIVKTSKNEIFGTSIKGHWVKFTSWQYSKPLLWTFNTIFSGFIGGWISRHFFQ